MRCGWIAAVAATLALTGCTLGAGNAGAAALQVASDRTEPATAAAFDAYLRAAVEHDHFSGTVLVAHDGVPVFRESYGMANYELNVPITSDTVFNIASITKQFTALAIMQSQEQGKLNVGDAICNYLDDCPTAWRPITIRHLLTHTSGIPNYSSLPDWDESLVVRNYHHGELVLLFRDLPLDFTPGTEHRYSNSGYQLLGLIVERASGMPYGQFLDQHIFAPLEMTHTGYVNDRSLIPNRATGYYSRGSSFINTSLQSPTVPFGDGGIHTTASDLLIWDQALYTERLLSADSREEIFTPALDNYAYGWRIGESLGRRQANHSGSGEGFSSYIIRFPDDHVTVIVLSNSDATNATRVGLALSAIYFGDDYALPVTSLHDILWDTIAQDGVAAAIGQYRELQRTRPSAYDFDEDETLVELGYTLYEADLLTEARQIFEFALQTFPQSAYSHDGLADIAVAQNDDAIAIRHFETSLALDPDNDYAVRGLARIRERQSR